MAGVIAVLHHLEKPVLGFAAHGLERAGADFVEHDLRRGDALPELGEVDGILSMGGEQSATEPLEHEYLRRELTLMRAAVDAEVPVLGVCLGGQLLAKALGAEVRRMAQPIIAWRSPDPLPAAADDALFASWSATASVLHWHEDVFDLPDGGTELVERSGPGVEAFRYGKAAWGVQFHPEADWEAFENWAQRARTGEEFDRAGTDEGALRESTEQHMGQQAIAGTALFEAFARAVARRVDPVGAGE